MLCYDYNKLSPKRLVVCNMLNSRGLFAEEGVWRDVEVVGIRDSLRGLSATALVMAYVDTHGTVGTR
jgi:hypothetical protein